MYVYILVHVSGIHEWPLYAYICSRCSIVLCYILVEGSSNSNSSVVVVAETVVVVII